MGCEDLRQRGFLVKPPRHLYLTGSPRGAALRTRPEFRLTRGSQLRAVPSEPLPSPAPAKIIWQESRVLSSQSWRPGRGTTARAGEPHTQPFSEEQVGANTWVLLGHHLWLRRKILPLEMPDVCHEEVKSGPWGQAGVSLSPGSAIHRLCDTECVICPL